MGLGDEWATPQSLFDAYDWEFGFTVDSAANPDNAKVANFFEDGLTADWGGHRVWCNPPYSDILPWVKKASELKAEVSVLLLPVRFDTDWWSAYVWDPAKKQPRENVEIRKFRKRVRFQGAMGSPAWATVLVIFWGKQNYG